MKCSGPAIQGSYALVAIGLSPVARSQQVKLVTTCIPQLLLLGIIVKTTGERRYMGNEI